MIKRFISIIITLICFLCDINVFAQTNIQQTEHVEIKLYKSNNNLYIAQINIDDGWHIYWTNPGEIGKPTTLKIPNSNKTPQILNSTVPLIIKAYDIFDEYIYKNTAYIEFTLPNKTDKLQISYIECNDVCKPESIFFDLQTIPITPKDIWNNIEKEARKTFAPLVNTELNQDQNSIIVPIEFSNNTKFIPSFNNIIIPDSIKISSQEKNTLIQWKNINNNILNEALLIDNDKIFIIKINSAKIKLLSLLSLILLAFIGGIILNAMPCVFPILSIKIMSLITKKENTNRLKNAILYTLGVIFSFWSLTAILIILKQQGTNIGWGFQLQSPYFVAIMIIIFIILFFAILDKIHLPNFNNNFIHKLSSLNEFALGFFAVLIASPCTGPFLGATIGYAFLHNNIETFAIFSSLALGYALPYALIELYPQILGKILPKPGKWMQITKYILSIPILITIIWLTSVFLKQTNFIELKNSDTLNWQEYDKEKIENLVKENKPVFINFTADWCLTCKFNDYMTLKSKQFKDFVDENNVALFKVDMTETNLDNYDALNYYERDSIPLYVIYKNGKPKILPLFFKINDLK